MKVGSFDAPRSGGRWRILAGLAIPLLLWGCGQRGPLYLPAPPEQPPKKTSQAAPSQPAAAARAPGAAGRAA